MTRRVPDATKCIISVISLVVSATLLIATPYTFWRGKPCHQRMSTLGVPSRMSKVFPPAYLTFVPHAGATTILLDLLVGHYSSKPPTVLTRFPERSGDVPPIGDVWPLDLPLFNTSMSQKPGDNRLCSLQLATSMSRRLRSLLDHSFLTCPRVLLSTPHTVTCQARHHKR